MVRAIAALALSLTLSGCSYAFVKGPPQVRPGAPAPVSAQCTTTMVLPIVDGVGAVYYFASSLYASTTDSGTETQRVALGVVWAGMSILLGRSASSGVNKVRACREYLATPVAPPTRDTADYSWMPPEWKGRPMIPTR